MIGSDKALGKRSRSFIRLKRFKTITKNNNRVG